MTARISPGTRHAGERGLVALVLAAAAGALARLGGAPPLTALALASGAAVFAAWRSVPGVGAGFVLLLVAALAGHGGGGIGRLGEVLPVLAGLEVFGLATVAAVAAVRRPRKISRRLLGAWLASSGLVASGLALATRDGARVVGGLLLAAGLAYRLGVVPAYAWAPMLLRHPARGIRAAGVVAAAGSAAALALVMARMPEPGWARTALVVLSAATLPWAAWQAVRQWHRDPACARTYAVVTALAAGVLLAAA